MKAKEYFQQFMNENQSETVDFRLVYAMKQLAMEAQQIAEIRKAQSDSAIIAIMKEQDLKAQSLIKMLNAIEPFKSGQKVFDNAFQIYISKSSPELAKAVWPDMNNEGWKEL